MPKQLHGAFIQEEDKARSNHLYAELAKGRWVDMDYRDAFAHLGWADEGGPFLHLLSPLRPMPGAVLPEAAG